MQTYMWMVGHNTDLLLGQNSDAVTAADLPGIKTSQDRLQRET